MWCTLPYCAFVDTQSKRYTYRHVQALFNKKYSKLL